MKRILHENVCFGVAALLAISAVAWSAVQLMREPTFRREQAQQREMEARLATLERDAAILDALRRPFANAGGGVDVNRQLQDIFGADGTVKVNDETIAPSDQFQVHYATVDYSEVAYETLTARIRAAEALRPPLKLTACVLEASPGKTGEGRSRLSFEQIKWR